MARSAIAFAFLALAASASTSSVAATSRHLLQAAAAQPAAAVASSGPQVQSTQPLNLPPGVSLTAPDGSAPKMPSPTDDKQAKVAAAVAAAQKEVVDQQTMKQFQAIEAQRDAARSADPSSDPLNAPRDDVLKTVSLPTADELKEFAESEQVKSFREALAAAPALPAVAAPKIPFLSGGLPSAPPKPSAASSSAVAPKPAGPHGPAHAPPHARPNAFASKHKAPEQPEPVPEPEEAGEESAADEEEEVETAEDADAAPADGPHVIEAKVVDAKQH